MFQVAIRCCIFKWVCISGSCSVSYNPEQDGIFFWTQDTAIVDEVGYSFINKFLNMSCSFSAFCNDMTMEYQQIDTNAASFVSLPVFIDWWFAWAASWKIDFRNDVDPFCSHSPSMLVGDGTHVGVSVRRMNVFPIQAPEDTERTVQTHHQRLDRIFLYNGEPDKKKAARVHLKFICSTILNTGNPFCPSPEERAETCNLVKLSFGDFSLASFFVVNGLVDIRHRLKFSLDEELFQDFFLSIACPVQLPDFEQALIIAAADFLKILSGEYNFMSSAMPYSNIEEIDLKVEALFENGNANVLEDDCFKFSPELKLLLERASASADVNRKIVCRFVQDLVARIRRVHSSDPEPTEVGNFPGTYNPSKGVFYYFTESGDQVRKLPKYALDSVRSCSTASDDVCTKIYPNVGNAGFSFSFFWLCPIHGHCYGGHLISGGEGKKDPFSSIMKYSPRAPDILFYDNACQFSEYSLNREPAFFRDTKFFHDVFHSYSHVCQKSFRSRRIPHILVNTEICEQFNAKLRSLKHIGSRLRQDKFMFLLQIIVHYWNKGKTKAFRETQAFAAKFLDD